ncbi:MAG: hypothetical protein IK117_08425 [Bacteroidales bacterium]|nr:hypothetical protein [Bacteroidales bacterium]
MTDEEITRFTDSLQEKLGEENSAVIADDLGELITINANTQKSLAEKDKEIARLAAVNEKLVISNGNLLKRVPVEHKSVPVERQQSVEEKPISFGDIFDKNGNFIK